MNLSCIHIFIKVNACKYPPQLEDSVYNPSYSLPIGGFSNNYLSHLFGNPPFRTIIRRIIDTIHHGRGFPSFYWGIFLLPPFLPFPLPCPPLPLSFLWIASLLILIACALPCLSYLLPPPLQPSLYYPFIDSLSFFPTQLWPAFNNI